MRSAGFSAPSRSPTRCSRCQRAGWATGMDAKDAGACRAVVVLLPAATGWTWSLGSLIAVRFLFGMGEAGCFPNLTRAFSTWLRPEERVRGQSILWLGARWGGAFTPLLVAGVLAVVSWRSVVLNLRRGSAWCGPFVFYRRLRDEPGDRPSVNDAERALLTGNPPVCPPRPCALAPGFSARGRPGCSGRSFFFFSYCWYFYVTWLPKFLKDSYGADHGKVVSRDAGGNSALCRRTRQSGGGTGSCPGLAARLGCGDRPARPADRGFRAGRPDVGLRRAASRRAAHRDGCHGAGEFLRRPVHAVRLGRLHGRRRSILREPTRAA